MDEPLSDLERQGIREKARGAVVTSLVALGGRATRTDLLEHAAVHGGFTRREMAATLVPRELCSTLSVLEQEGKVCRPQPSVWALSDRMLGR